MTLRAYSNNEWHNLMAALDIYLYAKRNQDVCRAEIASTECNYLLSLYLQIHTRSTCKQSVREDDPDRLLCNIRQGSYHKNMYNLI